MLRHIKGGQDADRRRKQRCQSDENARADDGVPHAAAVVNIRRLEGVGQERE